MGVSPRSQKSARSNKGAIKFFKRMGYGKPEAEVWMSKLIQRTRKSRDRVRHPTPVARRRAKLRQKIAKRRRSRRPGS